MHNTASRFLPRTGPSTPAARGASVKKNRNASSLAALTLGALGVVYGDIGTSPLYALKEVFAEGRVPLTEGKNEMTFDDGRVRETREQPGEVIWREPGIPHELLNCSDWQYRNVLIEIKTPAS